MTFDWLQCHVVGCSMVFFASSLEAKEIGHFVSHAKGTLDVHGGSSKVDILTILLANC